MPYPVGTGGLRVTAHVRGIGVYRPAYTAYTRMAAIWYRLDVCRTEDGSQGHLCEEIIDATATTSL